MNQEVADSGIEGVNWFDEGYIVGWSPGLVRRMLTCEIREAFKHGLLKSQRAERKAQEIFIPKDNPGVAFHDKLATRLITSSHPNFRIAAELEFPSIIVEGRYCEASADRIDFVTLREGVPRDARLSPETHKPVRVFEYKHGREIQRIYRSDMGQVLAIGLRVKLDGYDTSNMWCSLVFADYGCAPCPKVAVPTSHRRSYQCDQSECEKKNRLTTFDFQFNTERAWKIVRDTLDYLEGRRPPRASDSVGLCDACFYKSDCAYRKRNGPTESL